MFTFEDKVIIVTGGSRGIGASIVRLFHEYGAIVHFTYLNNKTAAEALINDLGQDRVEAHQVDNQNEDQIKTFVHAIGKKYKRIDTLVNNAGIVVRSLLANLSLDDWRKSFEINLTAPYLFSTNALRYLMKSENASIVNISSVTADRASRGLGAYCTNKAGLEALSKVLTLEYAPYKIRVNTVAPGLIETDVADTTSDEIRKKILSRTPLARAGNPSEISKVVLFLASSAASYVTGAQLYVTGGRHLE